MQRKNIADRILAGVFCLFTATAVLKYHYGGKLLVDMLFMVSEAALVGGIADWFAVTALFRRPLGFPWHTELIPRNRSRVIRSLVDVVEHDLLSVDAIKKRLADICFMSTFIDWVEYKNGKALVGRFAARAAQHFLETADIARLSGQAEVLVRHWLRDRVIVPRLGNAGHWAVQQGQLEQLVSFMLDELVYVIRQERTLETIVRYLDDVKEKKAKSVAARLVVWLGEQADSINTREAALALQQELLVLLAELRAPQHPVHIWAVRHIAENIDKLASDAAFQQAFTDWTAGILEQVSVHDLRTQAVQTAAEALETWSASAGKADAGAYPPLMRWIFEQVEAYWDSFKQDPDIHYWVERYVKKALFRLVETEHHLIGRIVQEALEQFNDQDLNDFVEDKAGDDLQWIRINGSIVGGIAGLLLFLFLRFVYDPVVVPLIRSWVL